MAFTNWRNAHLCHAGRIEVHMQVIHIGSIDVTSAPTMPTCIVEFLSIEDLIIRSNLQPFNFCTLSPTTGLNTCYHTCHCVSINRYNIFGIEIRNAWCRNNLCSCRHNNR